MNKKCNISGGNKPQLLGGFGEINFGKQYRQGNRVYDSNAVAMCLNAQPVGNAGGYSYLYLVKEKDSKKLKNKSRKVLTNWLEYAIIHNVR